jgi:acetyl esterase/lipase
MQVTSRVATERLVFLRREAPSMSDHRLPFHQRPTLALVPRDLLPWLEAMPDDDWSEATLAGRRKLIGDLAATGKPPLPPDVSLESRIIPGPLDAPALRVVVVRPRQSSPSAPAVLHLHGGGFVSGVPEMARATLASVAAELGVIVVSVDYRLAPETPFPGALDDAYAALAWLHAEADALGVDRSRIAVSGDSAGGGLAAGLALLARDRAEFALAFQHLVFPGLDDRTCLRKDLSPLVGEFIWSLASNGYAWRAWLGVPPGHPGVSPYAAPARAEDLSRLPPACVQVGALDLFLEENVEYARRLLAAGVPCELHVYPGAPHGFPMAWRAGVTRAFERDGLAALRRALHPDPVG